MASVLYKKQIPCADNAQFQVRTLGEIIDFGEEEYFSALSIFMATPWDYMGQLAEAGIDFETIDDFQLFLSIRNQLTPEMMEFLFGDTLSFEGAQLAQNNETNQIVLVTPNGLTDEFNASSLLAISDVIRQVHMFDPREDKRPGNKAAKVYLIEQAIKKLHRRRNKPIQQVLEPLIIALVNAPECPYDYQSIRDISIYQLFLSSRQIPRRLQWNFIMHGIHVGMIDASKLKPSQLEWMTPPKDR